MSIEPSRKHRSFALTLLLGLALVAFAFVSYKFVRFHIVEARFTSVKVGMSQAQVEGVLGNPSIRSVGCNGIAFPNSTCSLEYDYPHPFAPVLPEYFVVLFNEKGEVTNAYHTTSP